MHHEHSKDNKVSYCIRTRFTSFRGPFATTKHVQKTDVVGSHSPTSRDSFFNIFGDTSRPHCHGHHMFVEESKVFTANVIRG